MNDYAHFIRFVRTQLQKKLTQHSRIEPSGERLLTYLDVTMRMLDYTRLLPTIDLFSIIWDAWMSLMVRVWREVEACKYLDAFAIKYLASDLQNNFNIPSHCNASGSTDARLSFCAHWIGLAGTVPGTGSGNQCTEAFNKRWESELAILGKNASQHEALRRMQHLFSLWVPELELGKKTSMHVDKINPHLLYNTALLKIGTSPACHYWKSKQSPNYVILCNDPSGAIVAVAANANITLNPNVVQQAYAMLNCGGETLRELLLRCEVIAKDGTSGAFVLETARFRDYLVDIHFVFFEAKARDWHTGHVIACTCILFVLHTECSHCLFARCFNLACRPADVNLEDYPTRSSAKENMKTKTVPASKRAAAALAKRKAQQHAKKLNLHHFFPARVANPLVQEPTPVLSLKCGAGHELQKLRYGRGPKVCDLCCVEFSSSRWRWSCPACDYDVCSSCKQ